METPLKPMEKKLIYMARKGFSRPVYVFSPGTQDKKLPENSEDLLSTTRAVFLIPIQNVPTFRTMTRFHRIFPIPILIRQVPVPHFPPLTGLVKTGLW